MLTNYAHLWMRSCCFQMAVYGACQCYAAGSGPCGCAQVAGQMMEDIAQLNDMV